MANEKPLRFAILCRVSTEKQGGPRKTSLANQERQTRAAVETLGGTVTKEYMGDQHATPGFEHEMVERMLADAQRKPRPFDAVMLDEPSRWSRDNVASATGLDVFRAYGIHFYCGTTVYDLFDPTASMILTQFVTINQYLAAIQKQKAVKAKIEYAKQGRPTCGTGPHGRTWDKKRMEWGVDEAKKARVQDAAKRYLAGESLKNLAEEYGMGATSLRELLRNHCGPIFIQRFSVPSLNIYETVETKIPELLPPHTIKAIQKRLDRQRTGGGTGNNKFAYLLGGNVRCNVCGGCLSPQANGGTRYYRRAAACTHIDGMVRADDLENVVAAQLVGLLGNPAAVAKAAEAYQIALGNVKEQRAKLESLDKELATVAKAQKRAVDLLTQDLVDEVVVHTKLAELRERQNKLEAQRDHLADQLAAVPTQQAVEQAAKRAKRRLQLVQEGASHASAAKLSQGNLAALVAEAFANTTHPNGKWPGGVFITDLPDSKWRRPRRWGYELHGNLPYTGAEPGVDYGHTGLPPKAFERGGSDYDYTAMDCVNERSAP